MLFDCNDSNDALLLPPFVLNHMGFPFFTSVGKDSKDRKDRKENKKKGKDHHKGHKGEGEEAAPQQPQQEVGQHSATAAHGGVDRRGVSGGTRKLRPVAWTGVFCNGIMLKLKLSLAQAESRVVMSRVCAQQ